MAAKGKTKYSTILKVTVDKGSHSVLRISMQNIRQTIMWRHSATGRLTFTKRVRSIKGQNVQMVQFNEG